MHENVINHGSVHVHAIMHSLMLVHYRIVHVHDHGITKTKSFFVKTGYELNKLCDATVNAKTVDCFKTVIFKSYLYAHSLLQYTCIKARIDSYMYNIKHRHRWGQYHPQIIYYPQTAYLPPLAGML